MKVWVAVIGIAIVVGSIAIGSTLWTMSTACASRPTFLICNPVPVVYIIAYPFEFIIAIAAGIIVAIFGAVRK
ncbi:MAG: hypothetical protein ACRECH_09140 [Nitrososphaerales archaeon]